MWYQCTYLFYLMHRPPHTHHHFYKYTTITQHNEYEKTHPRTSPPPFIYIQTTVHVHHRLLSLSFTRTPPPLFIYYIQTTVHSHHHRLYLSIISQQQAKQEQLAGEKTQGLALREDLVKQKEEKKAIAAVRLRLILILSVIYIHINVCMYMCVDIYTERKSARTRPELLA